jgi:hypothetical protein
VIDRERKCRATVHLEVGAEHHVFAKHDLIGTGVLDCRGKFDKALTARTDHRFEV